MGRAEGMNGERGLGGAAGIEKEKRRRRER
jgi:hypothetical protein